MKKTIDHTLIWALNREVTGEHVHLLNNLICSYKGLIDVYNDSGRYVNELNVIENRMHKLLYTMRVSRGSYDIY